MTNLKPARKISHAITTVYFIRHGQTEWNAAGRFQGTQDIPLNDLGKEQAIRSGELLTDILARFHDPAKIPFVSSPLGRARNTMELLRGVLGVPPHDYELDDRLREIGYGHWEGSTLPQMEQSHPGASGADGFGDLYVTTRIVLPDANDAELEALMEKWRTEHPTNPRKDFE